jgi:hypothetical protein
MTKIENVWLNKETNEIRLDWSNNRHHAVKLESSKPEDVIRCLADMCKLVNLEIKNCDI